MPLTLYDWIYGSAQIGAAVLSIIAAVIAVSMLRISHQEKLLRGWRALLVALIFFMLEEVFGALQTFGIYNSPWITHVIPSVILGLLIFALINQLNVARGWLE